MNLDSQREMTRNGAAIQKDGKQMTQPQTSQHTFKQSPKKMGGGEALKEQAANLTKTTNSQF